MIKSDKKAPEFSKETLYLLVASKESKGEVIC
jgi:hypothetical protein